MTEESFLSLRFPCNNTRIIPCTFFSSSKETRCQVCSPLASYSGNPVFIFLHWICHSKIFSWFSSFRPGESRYTPQTSPPFTFFQFIIHLRQAVKLCLLAPKNGSNVLRRNVGKFFLVDTAPPPRRFGYHSEVK
jgi:hypothetical protein